MKDVIRKDIIRPYFNDTLEEGCTFCDERANARITGETHAPDDFRYLGRPADGDEFEFFVCFFHYALIRAETNEEDCTFCDERAKARITGETHAPDDFRYLGRPADGDEFEFFVCFFHYALIRAEPDEE
ncbi:hypothetical protein [Haladaptatus sp. NG-WS-4]